MNNERPVADHQHTHPHQQSRQIAAQLARTAGHVSSIKRMVEDGRDCPEILIQLAAVRAAIDRAAKLVLADHVESCLRGAAVNGMADEEWERLKKALDSFIR
jgi:CsoR family transcriptional regulator, copper-sensing transcriptional repressor